MMLPFVSLQGLQCQPEETVRCKNSSVRLLSASLLPLQHLPEGQDVL